MAKILVVDDSGLIRTVLKNFVKKEGHDVIEAEEGKIAIEKYKTEKPALVFMDILMPNGMDGLSAAAEIKKIDPKAKIVMVTSVREAEEMNKAKALGIQDYLNKPFSKEEITNMLKKYL